MVTEYLERPIWLNDAELFWETYKQNEPSSQIAIGAELDSRIGFTTAEFNRRQFDASLPKVTLEEVRVLHALQEAQRHVDHTYGERTGKLRHGCVLGVAVDYEI